MQVSHPFGEIWAQWWKRNPRGVSEGWRISQLQMSRDYLFPILQNVPFDQIRPSHVEQILTRIAEQGKSARLQKHVFYLIRNIFEDSCAYYFWRLKNPARHFLNPRCESEGKTLIHEREIKTLLSFQRATRLKLYIFLKRHSYLHSQEILSLRWCDLNFRTSFLKPSTFFHRKTGQSSFLRFSTPISIPTGITRELKTMKSDKIYIFSKMGKAKPMHYSTFLREFERHCRSCGVRKLTPAFIKKIENQ